jgi:hypothetical protein
MVEFNRKIERQLALLDEFWRIPEYQNASWSENEPIQIAYYSFLKEKEFIEGDAPRKAKDAREKTSGLVDLGLINNERRLTSAGQELLSIALKADYTGRNDLQISADGYIYLKQLLKVSYCSNGETIRPFVALAISLNTFGSISNDELTYLLPLATSEEKLQYILQQIKQIRAGISSIDDAILGAIMPMDNYTEALQLLLSSQVSEDLITQIGMNRKSRNYDKPYYQLYCALQKISQNATDENTTNLYDCAKAVSGKSSTFWKQYLFNTSSSAKIHSDGIATVNTDKPIFNCNSEYAFKQEFFSLLHLFKAKSLLSDYFDLNRRYFKTTETVLFQDGTIKFDIIPHCYFNLIADELPSIAYTMSDDLSSDISLNSILGASVSQEEIFNKLEELYGVRVRNLYEAQEFVDRERYERFNRMVDEKFTDETIISLMTMFENRQDNEIQAIVTNNADVPTIFEYVLAVAWYKISGRHGKVLEYMNLSLDADLLPITHAAGGHEDITYRYEETEYYPAHTLLIEATLANNTNQRRMEMEPVSRHLGEYMLSHTSEEAYCVFATTYLHINVVADFRGRKFLPYYSSDGSQSINGMKIIPCQTTEIKTIIQKKISYAELYRLFEQAYQSTLAPKEWYQQEIASKL